MNVLITGGAGYLGSHLSERLLRDHHSVILVDRFSNVPMSHPWYKKHKRRLRCIKADLTDPRALSKISTPIDWIFHMVAKSFDNTKEGHRSLHTANVTTTLHVLEFARRAHVKKCIYPMTSAIYGVGASIPTTERSIVSCSSDYMITKYVAEQMVLHWASVYKLPALSLRLSSIYGNNSQTTPFHSGILARFLAARKEGKRVALDGDGTQTRDFVYIDDVVNAFIAVAKSHIAGEVLNVGTGIETSLADLSALLGTKTIFSGKPKVAPLRNCVDIQKIYSTVGWKPLVNLEEGIHRINGGVN